MAQPASAYITQCRKTSLDKEAILHKRRKRALAALLSTFEKEIEPLIAAGNDKAIDTFKGDCRKKLNGIAWEAIELAKLGPDEHLNEHVVDLAEELAFDDQLED